MCSVVPFLGGINSIHTTNDLGYLQGRILAAPQSIVVAIFEEEGPPFSLVCPSLDTERDDAKKPGWGGAFYFRVDADQ